MVINKNPIKVINIIPSLNVGGREKVVIDLLNNFNSENFHQSLCCLKGHGPMMELLKNDKIKLFFLNKKKGLDSTLYFKISDFLKKERPAIVHTHNPGAFIYGGIGAKLAKIPIIVNTEHGYGYKISIKKKIIEKFLMKRIDKTIAVSDNLRKKLTEKGKLAEDKIITIHNGINFCEFDNFKPKYNLRESLGFKKDDIIVGNIARLAVVKDHNNLIDSFEIASKKNENLKLIIVGDGELRAELEKKTFEKGLNKKIFFLGERKDIKEILSILDIFVLSSISEGISITLLEAMASGRPVVATNVGGNPEIVINGRNGVLVPPSNPEILSKAIERLIVDNNFALQIGNAAREHIKKYFNIKVTVEKLEQLYEELLSEKNLSYERQ